MTDYLQNKKVLVTGANGYLGNYILNALKQDYSIVVLDRNQNTNGFETIVSDITKPINASINNQFDKVVHVAGLAHFIPKTQEEKDRFFNVNYEGTKNLLEFISKLSHKPKDFIFISTVSVYGLDTGTDIAENQPLNATEPYGLSKIQAEKAVEDYCSANSINYLILRLPLIAGANPPGNLGKMIRGIQSGKYFRIGEGSAKKSIVFAEDVASLIANTTDVSGIYNLTDGHHPTFANLEDAITNHLKISKVKSIPNFIIKTASICGDVIDLLHKDKFPLNSRIYNKIIHPLTFNDSLARTKLNWNPKKVVNNIDKILN